MTDKKVNCFLAKLKEKASEQENYGGPSAEIVSKMAARNCPNCGAARAKQDGLTHCAYCGFQFIATTLSNGVFIKKKDNSREAK